MISLHLLHFNLKISPRHSHQAKCRTLSLLILLVFVVAGCTSYSPLYLQNHFPVEAKPADVLQSKFSRSSTDRMPLGLAITLRPGSYDFPVADDESWPQLVANVKHHVEGAAPVLMDKVILVRDLSSTENLSLIQKLGKEIQTDAILVVLPSGKEVSGPARFDLLPEVSLMNGSQIDHYATIEFGLVDAKSGKLLLQVQGESFATLEKLDVPINSSRYPRVKGSAMSTYIYPEEGRGLEVLRAVALNEALEQATMKLQEKWPRT